VGALVVGAGVVVGGGDVVVSGGTSKGKFTALIRSAPTPKAHKMINAVSPTQSAAEEMQQAVHRLFVPRLDMIASAARSGSEAIYYVLKYKKPELVKMTLFLIFSR
jgi:hypothetical protein